MKLNSENNFRCSDESIKFLVSYESIYRIQSCVFSITPISFFLSYFSCLVSKNSNYFAFYSIIEKRKNKKSIKIDIGFLIVFLEKNFNKIDIKS